MEQRPKAIAVVAAFLFAAAAISAIVAVSLLFPGSRLDRMWELNPQAGAAFHAMGRIAGLLMAALAIGTYAAGVGLLQGRPWAWWFAVLLFVVNATGDLVSLWITADWLRSASGAAVGGAFLYVLMGRRVRKYFGTTR